MTKEKVINSFTDNISEQDKLPLIKDSEYCAADVQRLCSKKVAKNDYLVINCFELGTDTEEPKLVSLNCPKDLCVYQ